jgi:hypothetical protein
MRTPKTRFIIEPVDREARLNERLTKARENNECPVQVRVAGDFVVVLVQDLSEVDSCDCPACTSGADIASMFGFSEPSNDESPDENIN